MALLWLQAAVVLCVALAIWIIESYTTLALTWDLRVQDAVWPFFFLIMLTVLIALIGSNNRPAYFYLFAIGNGAGLTSFLMLLRRAARRPENETILRYMNYEASYALMATTVVIALATAVLLQGRLIGSWGAAVSTGALLLLMLAMTGLWVRQWWRSLAAA
jgi:hypothetical protein